jgi:tRNA dimethylallyltransferase
MLKAGALQEAMQLEQQYGRESEAMTGNIYRVLRQLAEGRITEDEAKQQVVASDMALAKRQLTWFRRNPYIVWDKPDQLLVKIDSWYNDIRGVLAKQDD